MKGNWTGSFTRLELVDDSSNKFYNVRSLESSDAIPGQVVHIDIFQWGKRGGNEMSGQWSVQRAGSSHDKATKVITEKVRRGYVLTDAYAASYDKNAELFTPASVQAQLASLDLDGSAPSVADYEGVDPTLLMEQVSLLTKETISQATQGNEPGAVVTLSALSEKLGLLRGAVSHAEAGVEIAEATVRSRLEE